MSRWEVWSFNLLTVAVAASGAVYFWMKDMLEGQDPFTIINHPWQPAMLKIHILFAPLFILVLGMLAQSHIIRKLRKNGTRSNRRSGLISAGSCLVMIASGYLLQIAGPSILFRILLILHLASGALFAGTYLAHQIIGFVLVRATPQSKAQFGGVTSR